MISKVRRVGYLAMAVAVLFAPTAFGQQAAAMNPEQFYLNQESAEKFGELRKSAKSSFQGILLYPDDIRNSVLELSQYPDLIALIKNKKVLNELEFNNLLKEKPVEVQAAIADLKAYPEVIGIMDDNIVVTALLGEMVKEKKEETVQVIKRLSDSVQAGHAKAVDAWTEKMQQDTQAVQELQTASEAYAKQNNLPSPNQPMTAAQAAANPNPYGYYVNEKNTVIIQDMPSTGMTEYMMANQMMYTMLFAAVMSHHSDYHSDYYWEHYDEHHDDWNARNDAINNNTSAINDLNDNIDEIQSGRDDAQQKLQDKKEDFQGRRDEAGTRPSDRQAKMDSLESKQMGNRLQQGGQVNNLQAKGSGFLGRRAGVSSQPLSRQQQISKASQFHGSSWNQRSSSGNFGSRGGGSGSSGGFSSSSGRSFSGGEGFSGSSRSGERANASAGGGGARSGGAATRSSGGRR